MARLYFLSSTTSDLSGGADFNRFLFYNNNSSATTVTLTVNSANTTEVHYGFTPPLHPSAYGKTGDYTVNIEVTTGNTNNSVSTQLHRINSSGTVQSSSTTPTAVSASAGVKTFTFTNLDLGTWEDGDRLRVDYRVTNTNNMNNQSIAISVNDPDGAIITPFEARSFVTT